VISPAGASWQAYRSICGRDSFDESVADREDPAAPGSAAARTQRWEPADRSTLALPTGTENADIGDAAVLADVGEASVADIGACRRSRRPTARGSGPA
jgi:hypothetical protein